MRQATEEDSEEGMISVPFSESEIRGAYPQVLLNSLGAEIKDPTRPDVRTLVDAAQVGRPTHSSGNAARKAQFPDASRVLNPLNNPAASKFDGRPSHRMVITQKPEHGLVSIVGNNGLLYANAVGTFGVGSAGQNWDRLACAAHRRSLKLAEGKAFPYYYFRKAPLFRKKARPPSWLC